jgi:hypothetical protein
MKNFKIILFQLVIFAYKFGATAVLTNIVRFCDKKSLKSDRYKTI